MNNHVDEAGDVSAEEPIETLEYAVVEYPAPGKPPAEQYPAPEEPPAGPDMTAGMRLTKDLLSGLSLYENWEGISPKKRKKRASSLRAKGLPIPNKDGVTLTLVV